jgi:hypothetical protein
VQEKNCTAFHQTGMQLFFWWSTGETTLKMRLDVMRTLTLTAHVVLFYVRDTISCHNITSQVRPDVS